MPYGPGYLEVPKGIDVYSWSPSPPGTPNAKCTQVHLVFGGAGNAVRMVVRFKGPETLDQLIDALSAHRLDVFGKRG